jgi:hypothetical protein
MALLGKLTLLHTARSYAKRHSGQVHSGIDRAAETVKQRVGERHGGAVDSTASVVKKVVTGTDRPPEERSGRWRRRRQ